MKKSSLIFLSLTLVFFLSGLQGEEAFVDAKTKEDVKKALLEKFGEGQTNRIEKGVGQAASLWREEDGTQEEFKNFCKEYFVSSSERLDQNFQKLETNYEVLFGHFTKMVLDLKRPLHLDWGEILPIDMVFGQFDPSAHLSEDLFRNKVAFFVLLNFPHYSLSEKTDLGPKWGRKEWGALLNSNFR